MRAEALKYVAILGLLAFLAVGVFAAAHIMEMPMNEHGVMTGCWFTGMAGPCPMTLSEHVASWHSLFTSVPTTSDTLSLVVLVLAVLLVVPRWFERYRRWVAARLALLPRLYLKYHPNLTLATSLREAFSQGILNPKVY